MVYQTYHIPVEGVVVTAVVGVDIAVNISMQAYYVANIVLTGRKDHQRKSRIG